MKNFSDFRGRPGQLPVRILKKELDIRHHERQVNHHARGQNENPKKVRQLNQPTAKKTLVLGENAEKRLGSRGNTPRRRLNMILNVWAHSAPSHFIVKAGESGAEAASSPEDSEVGVRTRARGMFLT